MIIVVICFVGCPEARWVYYTCLWGILIHNWVNVITIATKYSNFDAKYKSSRDNDDYINTILAIFLNTYLQRQITMRKQNSEFLDLDKR